MLAVGTGSPFACKGAAAYVHFRRAIHLAPSLGSRSRHLRFPAATKLRRARNRALERSSRRRRPLWAPNRKLHSGWSMASRLGAPTVVFRAHLITRSDGT
jgi:hypothetical protein